MERTSHANRVDRAYDDRLRCHWRSVTALSAQALRIDVTDGAHCDPAGAVEFAKAVMPGVRHITLTEGGKEFASYAVRDDDWSQRNR